MVSEKSLGDFGHEFWLIVNYFLGVRGAVKLSKSRLILKANRLYLLNAKTHVPQIILYG